MSRDPAQADQSGCQNGRDLAAETLKLLMMQIIPCHLKLPLRLHGNVHFDTMV
jgi:hypothetical protein